MFEGYPFGPVGIVLEGFTGLGKDKCGVELMSSECAPWGKLSPKESWAKKQQRHKI